MIKKSIAFVILAVFLISCSRFIKFREENYTKVLSENLIDNGDFEIFQENIDKTIPGWLFDKVSTDKVAIDTTRSFSGNSCLKISTPSREIQLVTKPFNCNHRNVYGVRFSGKSILRKIPIVVHFLTFSENGKIVSKYYSNITIDTKWQTFSLVSDFLNVNSVFGRVFITIPKNDSVLLLDDISCHVIDSYQKK